MEWDFEVRRDTGDDINGASRPLSDQDIASCHNLASAGPVTAAAARRIDQTANQ